MEKTELRQLRKGKNDLPGVKTVGNGVGVKGEGVTKDVRSREVEVVVVKKMELRNYWPEGFLEKAKTLKEWGVVSPKVTKVENRMSLKQYRKEVVTMRLMVGLLKKCGNLYECKETLSGIENWMKKNGQEEWGNVGELLARKGSRLYLNDVKKAMDASKDGGWIEVLIRMYIGIAGFEELDKELKKLLENRKEEILEYFKGLAKETLQTWEWSVAKSGAVDGMLLSQMIEEKEAMRSQQVNGQSKL